MLFSLNSTLIGETHFLELFKKRIWEELWVSVLRCFALTNVTQWLGWHQNSKVGVCFLIIFKSWCLLRFITDTNSFQTSTLSCVRTCGGRRSVFSLPSHLYLWDRVLTEPGVHPLTRLVVPWAPGLLLFCLPALRSLCMLLDPDFYTCAEVWAQFLMLVLQALYP